MFATGARTQLGGRSPVNRTSPTAAAAPTVSSLNRAQPTTKHYGGPPPAVAPRAYGITARHPQTASHGPPSVPSPSHAHAPHRGPVAAKPVVHRSAAQQEESAKVVAFLKEAGLHMYAPVLLQSGFDDLETLAAIEDADMRDLGIPSHLTARLRRKINELRGPAAGENINPNHPVVVFLRNAGLEQYAPVLIGSGFDDMETVLLIDDLDMKELGFARGHMVKMKKRLRDYELQLEAEIQGPPPPQAWAPQRPAPVPAWQAPAPQQRAAPVHAHAPPPPAQAMPAQYSAGGSLMSMQGLSVVERSWEQVQAYGSYAVGGLFYKHYFSLAPDVMELYPPEVRQKYREWTFDEDANDDDDSILESPALRKLFGKIVNAVGCTVAGLHDMGKLVPLLTKLGARHFTYGACENHFPILGKALDRTLRDLLGPDFTHEVQQSWTMVYGFMSAIMIMGYRQACDEYTRNAQCVPDPVPERGHDTHAAAQRGPASDSGASTRAEQESELETPDDKARFGARNGRCMQVAGTAGA